MPNRFERVSAPEPDCVTVRLWRSSGSVSGETIGPAKTGYRAGAAGDLSPDQALAAACGLANRYGLRVVVMDADSVWPARWGELVDTLG